jgi:hypothetical protein
MSTYNNYNDERPSSNSTALTIFAIVVVALIAIGMFMWQPWNAAPAASSPTIINQPAPSGDKGDTTIINPPSNVIVPPANEGNGSGGEGGKTEININGGTGTGTTGETTGDATTGG